MLRHTLRYKIKFLRFLIRERLKYLHIIRVSYSIKITATLFLFSSVCLSVFVVVTWIRTYPTQSTFTRELIYQAYTEASQSVTAPLAPQAQRPLPIVAVAPVQSRPTQSLFDYDTHTFVHLSKITHTLSIYDGKKEVKLTSTKFFPETQALRINKNHLLLLNITPLISHPNIPSKLSIAFLNIQNPYKENLTPIQTQFILPNHYLNWEPILAKTTLYSYGNNDMLLRLSKEIVIAIQTNGLAKWIHIPPLVAPYLNQETSHIETALSSQKAELYFALLTSTQPQQKTYQFTIARYNMSTKAIVERYETSLKQFNYFNISETDRLITTFFDTRENAMLFKFQPLKKANFVKTLFSQDIADKTLIKKLSFSAHPYPKGLRFNGVGLIGFYETATGARFWNWE